MGLDSDTAATAGACRNLRQALHGPEDDGEQPRPYRFWAWACIHFGWVQILASGIVWYYYGGIGPTIQNPPVEEIRLFDTAKVMLFPALLLELCYVLSARNSKTKLQRNFYEVSYLLLIEFLAKMICYVVMSQFSGGVVHVNLRAIGGVRGCYTVRFLEWSVAVPALIIINNHPLNGTKPLWHCIHRLWPNMFVTWAYILASWLAQVTPHAAAGWFLVILSFIAYLVAVGDQVDFVRESDRNIEGRRFKVSIVAFKEVMFFAYGVWYLIGLANMLSSLWEQTLYTYGDVLLKVLHASVTVVVRNWEDLAQLHQALEDKVETGKQDMSRLFRRASAPIFAATTEGCIVAWNDHLAKVSGIKEEDAIGRHVVDFIHEESKETVRNAIEACRDGLSSSAVEVMLSRISKGPKHEDEQPVQILLTLIVQQGSDPGDMILGMGQDLTEVAQLRALQERKARFTAVLGHELRSPLHGIMGLSGTMSETTSDKNQKRQLAMIKGCAARLLDLVTNIMEMAKAEKLESTGNSGMKMSNVNMIDIVEEVLGMTEMAVDKAGKHLVSNDVRLVNDMSDGKLPIVKGDEYKLTQLLYNLVTNAAKFTKKGSIHISAREVGNNMLELDVADTGYGISAEGQKEIFEPFQQEHNKESRNFQGIGLGLSVAMSIAKLHGGIIRVSSTLGKGSTFTVCLPCDSSHRVARTSRADADGDRSGSKAKDSGAVRTKSGGGGGGGGGGKINFQVTVPKGGVEVIGGQLPLILSVDDDEINQEVIERTFGSEYRVVRAMNGMEALDYLDSGKEFPSIVLLDVMMPGMTGFEVVKEIRSKRFIMHMQLPVVMLSARSPQDATATEALVSGATDYMQKPFNSSMLKLRLKLIDDVRNELRMAETGARGAIKDATPVGTAVVNVPVAKPAVAAPPAKPAPAAPQPAQQQIAPANPNQIAEAAARMETMQKLTQERDTLRARLEATLKQSSVASAELKTAIDERDRLKAQLSEKPRTDDRVIADTKTMDASASRVSLHSVGSYDPRNLDYDFAERSADFYRVEMEQRERDIATLREKVDRHKSEAYLQRHRADGLERELRFVRSMSDRLSSHGGSVR